MAMQDTYGCDVTTTDARALQALNRTIKGFLSHAGSTGNDLGTALQYDPNLAIAHAIKGLFFLLLGRRELDTAISSAYTQACVSDFENPATARERHYIQALGEWINGRPSHAINKLEQVLNKHPHDPLAMKLSHAIRFMLGDLKGMRTSLENISHVYKGHGAEGYFLGCHAFSLEETGEYDLAERRGRKAIELAPDDAWGLHAVAHVFDMTGRPSEGLAWINNKEATWEHCNNFRYHVWWHIALMQLDLGQYDKVLELYDDYIRKDKTDDYRDISNATSVLLRLEFEGVEVGNRWEELSALASTRMQDNCVAFADLHYMMALCNSDDQSKTSSFLSSMGTCAATRQDCEFATASSKPGLLAAKGLEAFRDHDFALACKCLATARPALQTIGGSHAQRDIFERLGIESAIRGGLIPQAVFLLDERDKLRGSRDGYSHSRWTIVNEMTNNNVALQGAA